MALPLASLLLVLGVLWLVARWRARKQKGRDGMTPGHAHKATYRGVTNDADPETSSNYWDNTSKDASVEKEMIENKFGTPRSEMYSLTFHPIDEDLTALIQVAIRDASRHVEVAEKLQQLRVLCGDLPGSGWVQPQDPRVLLRFLIARKCDVEQALDMLHSVLEWRQENATSLLSSWGKSDQGKHEKFDLYWKPLGYAGLDHEGDPVFYERVGQNDLQGLLNCNQEFIREHSIYNAECVFASLELARRKNLKKGSSRGFQLTVVVDLDGLDLSFMDRHALAMLQMVGRVESDNYPEGLKRVIIIRPPWIFPLIWRVCRPFLDQGTIDKIEVVHEGETAETLLRHIPAKHVPKALGGEWFDGDDDYCARFIAPGGTIPQEIIDMTFPDA